jgi:pimeloyl-ACP methyl ester carboxylesterase
MSTPMPERKGVRAASGRRRPGAWGSGALTAIVVLAALSVGDGGLEGRGAAGPRQPVGPEVSTTTQPLPVPPFPVEDETFTFVDPTRETPARGDVPGSSERVLVTDIRRPVGPKGPLPLVVFAHGWNSNPTVYESLLDAWAAAGYMVAAPVFPDSADTLPGPPVSNYPEQALDLSFVITSLLGGRAGPVDPTRIAVAGHSDGGTDVALLALNPSYADRRVKAYLSLSGEIPAGVPGPWGVSMSGSLLVAVGTDDQYGLLPKATQIFDTAMMTGKVLLTVTGGDHLDMYIGSSPEAVALRAETVRFLNYALGHLGASSTQLASALAPAGDPSIVVSGT